MSSSPILNSIKSFTFPYRFFSAAIVIASSIALAAPPALQRAPGPVVTGDDATPASMKDTVAVMVELNAAPAAVSYAAAYKIAQAKADADRNYALKRPTLRTSKALLTQTQPIQISASAAQQVASVVKQIDQAQQAMLPSLTAPSIGGKVMYRLQRAYNGIAMYVSPDKISEISKIPGVKAVHPMVPKQPTAFQDIDFLGTRSFWTKPVPFGGVHGENVKVAVIDSGLDYVHTNFGGNADYTGVTDTNPNGHFPSFKVPGGYDFVGDAYNANDAVPIIAPDSNPWDGNPAGSSAGHGTACASLIGGYGVTAGGTTYFGSYDALTDIAGMKISPGHAPNCRLYPLRVFGNSGSTNFTSAAIEWAMDPNGDGNFADKMDIISMSLGSNEGFADDDSAISATNAASIGIIVCSAAGNAGDTYYIHSSPAAAPMTLSVAASFNDQAGFIYNATVTPNTNAGDGVPPDGKYKAIYGSASPHTAGLTGDVVYGVPNNASTAFTNPADISGKICLVNRGATNFTDMVQKAFNAGAIGVIVVNHNNPGAAPIVMATTGQPNIPAVMISSTDRDEISTAAGGFDATTGQPTNSPVNVTIADGNGTVSIGTAAPDTMPSYSARGPRLPDSSIKPDLTSPAEIVGVATNRTGSEVRNFNGTSSATPHVAGAMALMKQLHPTWSVEELLALACNTATNDLFTTVAHTTQFGVGRVGSGRVDHTKASNANVVAFNQTNPGLLNVSFGAVEVPVDGTKSATKTVKVVNKSASDVTYNITYQAVTAAAGASFSLPASVTALAGSSNTFNVTFNATGSALRHDRDLSVSTSQSTIFGAFSRQYLTEITGYAVLTPTSGPEPTIRVALYAAPKPSSSMHATVSGIVPEAPSGSFTLNLSGASINTGASFPTDIVSYVKAFELQYASPLAGSPSAPTDPNVIKYVGITSDWALRSVSDQNNFLPVLNFGLEGFGNAAVPEFNASDKEIFIDVDFDDNYDVAVFLSSLTVGTSHSNVYFTVLFDIVGLYGPPGTSYFDYPTNGRSSGATSRDTNSFNNSAITVPIDSIVGTGFTSFQYQVVTFDRNGNLVDQTPVLFYDAAAPGLDATTPAATLEPFFFNDLATTNIAVNYNGTNFQTNGSRGVLLLHMHNGTGNHADVVAFRKPTISSFSPTSGKVGANITITGSNFGPGTVVTFNSNKVATVVNVITPNTLVAQVPVGAISGPIRVSNAAGFSSKPGFTVLP